MLPRSQVSKVLIYWAIPKAIILNITEKLLAVLFLLLSVLDYTLYRDITQRDDFVILLGPFTRDMIEQYLTGIPRQLSVTPKSSYRSALCNLNIETAMSNNTVIKRHEHGDSRQLTQHNYSPTYSVQQRLINALPIAFHKDSYGGLKLTIFQPAHVLWWHLWLDSLVI